MTGDPFVIVPLRLVADRRLTLRMRVVLEALMSFRGKRSGHVYAEREQIAERCAYDVGAISIATNDLARAGYIRIKRNRRGGNDYFFRFPFHDWSPEQDVAESAISRNLDVAESESRCSRFCNQDVAESATPLSDQYQTNNRERGRAPDKTLQNLQYQETDDEPRNSCTVGHAEPRKSSHGSRLTLTELPEGWKRFAEAERPDLDPVEVWKRFRDYWIAVPGAKGRKVDWLATWRNWVRRESAAKKQPVADAGPVGKAYKVLN